jgi:iron complex outermembrane receptor protein
MKWVSTHDSQTPYSVMKPPSHAMTTAMTTFYWGVFMRVTATVAAITFSLVNLSAASEADAAVKQFTQIPSQSLDAALETLAKQRNFQILYRSEIVGQLQTDGAVGELTAQETLEKLLSGTGLTYRYLDERAVTILPVAPGGDPKPDSASVRKPSDDAGTRAPDTSSENGVQKPSFWDRFRLAQADQGTASSISTVDKDTQSSDRNAGNRIALEEVIVTATKREERLLDAPQSVSVVSSDALAKIGATQFRDFANTVPGLTFTSIGAGYTQISLRGVTTGAENNATVGIYVDDIPYGSSSAFAFGARLTLDVGLFDVDRVEVLRGPQGTLYGASTMGGLVKYVTKQPDASSFGVDAQVGTSGTRNGGVSYNGVAVVNAPIVTDKAAVRASGYYSRDGGYIDNIALGQGDVNRSDVHGARVDVLLEPTEALSIRIGGFLQDISRDGQATADYTLVGKPEDGSLDQNRLVAEPFDQRFRLVSGTVAYDLGPATLTSISSYQWMRATFAIDLSRQFVPLLNQFGLGPYSALGFPEDTTTNRFTQEVRLASDGARPLEWLIGGFYTHETSEDKQAFAPLDLAGQPAPNDLFTFATPSRYEEIAGFGDLTYHLTSRFDVSGGLRYARNRQTFTQIGSGLLIGSTPTRRSSENVSTYLGNARYHVSDHATGYLRYATGYRPGGPNFVGNDPSTGLPLGPTTFDADRLKSYEAGFKAESADRNFGIDVAGYYIDWNDIQILTSRGGFGVFANAGGATVHGAELTLTARPTRDFTLTGAFAYQDAHLSEAAPDLGGAEGERLPNVPRFTTALNGDYQLPVGSMRPTIGATLRYVSDRTASFDNSTSYPQYRLPDYTTADLRAGFALGSLSWQLYIHNLFDKQGQLSSATNRGPAQVAILQPRTVGITATAHF